MNVILNYITDNNIINSKTISKSFERKMLKTFDFDDSNNNISGILNYIWKKQMYEVLICYDNNIKVERLIYITFELKEEAFSFYENIYNYLLNIYGED